MTRLTAIDELLHGAIDLHTHSGPSPMPRRITHVEAARQASEAGFRAILVKCHYHSTVTDVLAMAPELDGLDTQVFGGVALNSVTGGLNPHAVDLALRLGGKIVWFPTISSAAHLAHAKTNAKTRSHFQPLGMMAQEEVPVLDDDGEVLPRVRRSSGSCARPERSPAPGTSAPTRPRPWYVPPQRRVSGASW